MTEKSIRGWNITYLSPKDSIKIRICALNKSMTYFSNLSFTHQKITDHAYLNTSIHLGPCVQSYHENMFTNRYPRNIRY